MVVVGRERPGKITHMIDVSHIHISKGTEDVEAHANSIPSQRGLVGQYTRDYHLPAHLSPRF